MHDSVRLVQRTIYISRGMIKLILTMGNRGFAEYLIHSAKAKKPSVNVSLPREVCQAHNKPLPQI
jgi:hypothetical protein